MREVVLGVYLMERMLSANVYALQSDKGLTLVDSGTAVDTNRVLAQLEQAGFMPSDVHKIILTHWHGDHSGGAMKLARQTGAKVMAHRQEAPIISQTQPIPASSRFQRQMNWLSEHVVLPRPPCHIDRVLDDGDMIDALGGTLVIHAPGHSPGSLCLYQPERQILFCGDSIFNKHPITQRPGLGLHMRFLTLNNSQAYLTASRLSAMPIRVLCPGHGEPILEDAHERMKAAFPPV